MGEGVALVLLEIFPDLETFPAVGEVVPGVGGTGVGGTGAEEGAGVYVRERCSIKKLSKL